MDDIAATKEQADRELKKLRKERGVTGREVRDSVLVSSLDRTLNMCEQFLMRDLCYAKFMAASLINSIQNRPTSSLN